LNKERVFLREKRKANYFGEPTHRIEDIMCDLGIEFNTQPLIEESRIGNGQNYGNSQPLSILFSVHGWP